MTGSYLRASCSGRGVGAVPSLSIRYGKIEFLRRNYPELWKLLLRKGLGKVMLENKLGINPSKDQIEHLIDMRPCMFDKY